VTWNPPADVRAAGELVRGRVPYVGGTALTSDDVRTFQLPVQPGTRALREYIAGRWGVSVGAPRGASVRKPARRADGTLRNRDVHEEGRAVDVMSEANRELGAEVANWAASRAAELGLQFVLFDRFRLSSGASTPWGAYDATGRNPHTDHVHIELSPAAAADGARMRALLGMPARADANAVAAPHTVPATPGPERTRQRTGPRPFERWSAERFELLYRTLRDVGLPPENARHTARAVLALWITETGWNESAEGGESNFNPGNITSAGPYGYFRIPGNPRRFRAYADAGDGVRDAVRVLSTGRYRAAWDALVQLGAPVSWYDAILRAGYTAHTPALVEQYANMMARIPRRLQQQRQR
jgi:hypothetical protein